MPLLDRRDERRRLAAARHLGAGDQRSGAPAPGLLGIVPDAAVVLEDEQIVWVGRPLPAPAADAAVDLGGRAVLPGWVDSHSHVVFAGDRAAEFSARMAGQPYRAGGMQSTVAATRRPRTTNCWPSPAGIGRR